MDSNPVITLRDILDRHGRLAVSAGTLDESADLFDAGMDSQAAINVMLALEDDLGFEFPEDLLNRATFSTMSSLLKAIRCGIGRAA